MLPGIRLRAGLSLLLLALLLGPAACGPFQVGIETPRMAAEATPPATAAEQAVAAASSPPDAGLDMIATVVALQTANAALAGQVATLTAAQAQPAAPGPVGPTPPVELPATPMPTSTAIMSPAATATPAPPPALPPTRITFQSGSASATVSPDLANGSRSYVLKVLAGQHLILTADSDLVVQVTGPDGRPLAPVATRPRQWEYAVGQTGDQTITLTGTTRATVTIYVPPR